MCNIKTTHELLLQKQCQKHIVIDNKSYTHTVNRHSKTLPQKVLYQNKLYTNDFQTIFSLHSNYIHLIYKQYII